MYTDHYGKQLPSLSRALGCTISVYFRLMPGSVASQRGSSVLMVAVLLGHPLGCLMQICRLEPRRAMCSSKIGASQHRRITIGTVTAV